MRIPSRLALLAAVLSVAVFAVPAAASDDPPESSGLPPGGTFFDDDVLPAEGFIEANAEIGVMKGCNPPANSRF